MKKSILSILMAGAFGLMLVGCGNKAEVEDTAETQVKEATEELQTVDTEDDEEAVDVPEEENSITFIKQAAEEMAPSIDITDCATFTDLLNKDRVSDGMGWTNIDIGETNCFMVTSGTFDNLDGNMAGISATIFIYKDGEVTELGKVCSGGTAYPIAEKDGNIFTASNHWVSKYAIEDNKLVVVEAASVEYDSDGNGTYTFESETDSSQNDMDSAEAEEKMEQLYNEMGQANIINFDTVGE